MNERRWDLIKAMAYFGLAVLMAGICCGTWQGYGLSIRTLLEAPFGQITIIIVRVFMMLFSCAITLWYVAKATKEEK